MGVKNWIARKSGKVADKIAKMAVLSPEQLNEVQANRERYLSEMPSLNDEAAEELTSRLIAACSTEVFNSYLDQLEEYYVPVQKDYEYPEGFRTNYNIRYFNISKWVTDTKENGIEKLVNVYEVLSNADCNIALIFHRKINKTEVYLAVVNNKNADNNNDVENYKARLLDSIRGNFPGAEWKNEGTGVVPCLKNDIPYSVACASNIPAEKSEKFISQTIEKLLDGVVPRNIKQEYTIILLATPITDIENRKIHLAEIYSGLAPYASWETNYTFTESDSMTSNATFGVNVGASAGIQQGQTQANTNSRGETENESKTETDNTSQTDTDSKSHGETNTDGNTYTKTEGETNTKSLTNSKGGSSSEALSNTDSHTDGTNESLTTSARADADRNILARGWHTVKHGVSGDDDGVISQMSEASGKNVSDTYSQMTSHTDSETWSNAISESKATNIAKSSARSTSKSIADTVGSSVAKTIGRSVANTLGKAVTNTVSATNGIYKGVNLGANVGANFARSSNVTATVGKNEGIIQHFTNYNIKHLLENLENQMKRYEQSTALGMWDFAAYVLSWDLNVASNVAHSYLALTQGEKSYMAKTAVNIWRGDLGEKSNDAKEICSYIRELRHPVFALNPELTKEIPVSNVYPAVVTATTVLSGKELAYSLNFPQKSISGLPVVKCTEFGRNIVSYDIDARESEQIRLGSIFHMNRSENTETNLSIQSLSSHVFVTGSTGSGKSNTVYNLIDECKTKKVKFLVIEPAKGEYKAVFGMEEDVHVYGTNPYISDLLKINPFSFPDGIHVYEHMDRLVEIFNVCWPMYAAMPAVLKSAIEKSYEDCGWDLIKSENRYRKKYYPTFSDVSRNIKDIIESSEYDAENKGAYKGSLLTRLQSLSNGINGMIFSSEEIHPEELFDQNAIVDLSRVGSTETKSLLMGMLVLKLQEYRMSKADGINSKLNHITILEEAHNILKRTSTEQPVEGGNLAGKSVEMISNAIAEMRTYGEGFIIVDQAPGLMDMSVIRNTNTKIIMRLPDQSDRELVGKAANLNEEQITELAKLPCGVGAVYQNDWIQPVLCKVDLYNTGEGGYQYIQEKKEVTFISDADRIYIADILSKGMKLGRDMEREEIDQRLSSMPLSDYERVSIIKMLVNPPKEPDMVKMAPIMSALFPDIKEKIKNAHELEADVSEWTREANELLLKYNMDDQVRRDIIQATITHYMLYEVHNRGMLENWIERGGFR